VNVQISYDASWEGRGVLKPLEYCHMGEVGLWPNHHITFIVAEKA